MTCFIHNNHTSWNVIDMDCHFLVTKFKNEEKVFTRFFLFFQCCDAPIPLLKAFGALLELLFCLLPYYLFKVGISLLNNYFILKFWFKRNFSLKFERNSFKLKNIYMLFITNVLCKCFVSQHTLWSQILPSRKYGTNH
jgi:hypothetical protein